MIIVWLEVGWWFFDGEFGEGSWVIVVSDLCMVVSLIFLSFFEQLLIDLNIVFYEDGEQISDQEFLQVFDVCVSVVLEDGCSGIKSLFEEGVLVDGVFMDMIS